MYVFHIVCHGEYIGPHSLICYDKPFNLGGWLDRVVSPVLGREECGFLFHEWMVDSSILWQ